MGSAGGQVACVPRAASYQPETQELDMKIKTKVRAGRAGCGTVVIKTA